MDLVTLVLVEGIVGLFIALGLFRRESAIGAAAANLIFWMYCIVGNVQLTITDTTGGCASVPVNSTAYALECGSTTVTRTILTFVPSLSSSAPMDGMFGILMVALSVLLMWLFAKQH